MNNDFEEKEQDMAAEKDDMNPRKRGLGRGLNALFEDGEDSQYGDTMQRTDSSHAPIQGASPVSTGRLVLSVAQLVPNKNQPRQLFKDETLNELADSIKEHGILQPLLVRPIDGDDDQYEIIAGERRWRASQIAQIHEVPVIITDHDNAKMQEIALIENLQREDLNPVDESAGYKYMMDEYGYTQELLAKKMGKSRSHISNMLRLNDLPERVARYLANGDITMGHARALVSADKPEKLVERVVEENLSVRDTEKMVQRVKAAAEGRPVPAGKNTLSSSGGENQKTISSSTEKSAQKAGSKDVDTLALERDLSNTLGMGVSIDQEGASSRGTISISYRTLDQLDFILERFSFVRDLRLNK